MSTLSATVIETLAQLKTMTGMEEKSDPSFFPEWRESLPKLEDRVRMQLDGVKADYLNMAQYEPVDPLIKMVMVSPLLHLAGLYRHPFRVRVEKRIELATLDGDRVIRGQIDSLVCHEQIWIMVIEAKQVGQPLIEALLQSMFHILRWGKQDVSTFGLITNGSEFQFIKLQNHDKSYGRSYTLSLDREDDLYMVVRVLKQLATVVLG